MSLEAALAAHQKALEANTAALLAFGGAKGTDSPAPKPAAAKQPEAPKPAAQSPTPQATSDLSYEKDIKPIALALAKKSREALTKIWGALNVKVGTELKPEQFAEAKRLIEDASK